MDKFRTEDGKHYIDNKEVKKATTYISMLEEQINKLSAEIDVFKNKKPILENIEHIEHDDCEDMCPECQNILDLIYDMADMEPHEAVGVLKTLLSKTYFEGIAYAHNEMGSLANKMAARFELQIEEMCDVDEETFEG
jgi:ATP-dependent helicase YprA (DUF1998 family)